MTAAVANGLDLRVVFKSLHPGYSPMGFRVTNSVLHSSVGSVGKEPSFIVIRELSTEDNK